MKWIHNIRNNPRAWAREAFPIVKWLPKYDTTNIPYDLIAGFTVGLTLLPVSLAYAQMAYLKPEYGLYSSFLGTFIYLFLGTAKDAIIGPSAIGSMLLAQFNVQNPLYLQGDNTYATILALISGIIFLIIGFFKLGFIVNLFSIPVVSGFTSAAAFAITASQLRTLVGIRKGPNDSPGVFVKQIKNIYDRRSEILLWDVAFGLCSLAFLLFMEYGHALFVKMYLKRAKEPQTERGKKMRELFLSCLRLFVAARNIMVFIPTCGVAYYLSRQYPDIEKRITMVGKIKEGFPTPSFPSWQVVNHTKVWVPNNSTTGINGTWVYQDVVLETTQEVIQKLSVAIIIIPLMGIMELFAILKALGRKNGYRIDATQELMAVGLSNFLQSFIQSYPITAATAKSVLNDQCRVKSLLSTILSIIIILVSIGCLTDVFYYVPKAALSAILVAAAHHLFDYNAAWNIWKEYKPDFVLFVLTFLLCLLYDLAYGIVIAILINLVFFIHPIVSMHLSVVREPFELFTSETQVDGKPSKVVIIQLSHGLKYPSVDKFVDKMTYLLSTDEVHFVLDCKFVSGLDFTGMQAWRMLLRMVYQSKKHIVFANLTETVRCQLEAIGLEHFKYAGDVETAISDFSSALADELVISGNADRNKLRRLRQTVSIVSSGPPFVKHPSRQTSKISGVHADLHAQSTIATINETSSSSHSNGIPSPSSPPNEETRQEQEAKLMKLLTATSTPHLYDDLPLAIGSGEAGGLSDVGEWGDLKGDDDEDFTDYLQFPTYPIQFNLHGSTHQLQRSSSNIPTIIDKQSDATLRRRRGTVKSSAGDLGGLETKTGQNSIATQTGDD